MYIGYINKLTMIYDLQKILFVVVKIVFATGVRRFASVNKNRFQSAATSKP